MCKQQQRHHQKWFFFLKRSSRRNSTTASATAASSSSSSQVVVVENNMIERAVYAWSILCDYPSVGWTIGWSVVSYALAVVSRGSLCFNLRCLCSCNINTFQFKYHTSCEAIFCIDLICAALFFLQFMSVSLGFEITGQFFIEFAF